MQNSLSCEQVTALLSFYAEDKLSSKLAQYVKQHLEKCPSCMEKFMIMKNMLTKLTELHDEELENPYATKQYEDFKSNLSAYVDNELNNSDSIKIKKIAISNPLARQDLENIYTFKKLLYSSFEKTKNDMKNDYSRIVINQLQLDEEKSLDPFFKLSAAFVLMLTLIVAGIIKFLYF